MEMTELIKHPELLDRETLYELRSTLALYPYFQTVRLLMLHNLYLLHDPSFDEELRKTALYVTDRKTIFNMVEAAHYQLRKAPKAKTATTNRTVDLIDSFLGSIPAEAEEDKDAKKRKPTPADAAVDYVSYLMATMADTPATDESDAPQMKGQDLIDNFLEKEQGRIMLSDIHSATEEEQHPQTTAGGNDSDSTDHMDETDEEYFTETLARIYIKQGRYQKAREIIGRLNEKFPHKNAYFADQMRFLEKLIINNNNNNKNKK